MKKKAYGYMRVSSVDQNIERQNLELIRWGIEEKNIYSDKISGKDFERPAYQRMKQRLKEGDILVVKSIDRLGRNYDEIQKEWRMIVKEIQADIVIIDMPILDTRTRKDLIGTLISDIVLQLLSYVAQTEREFIRQRQAEGIAIAQAQGKHLGRPPKPYPENFAYYMEKWHQRIYAFQDIKEKLKLSDGELRWLIRRWNQEQKKESIS